MIYCESVYETGSGLGTRLFAWARCSVFSHVNQVPMLAPLWIQPRIGPLLRGGIDLQSYPRQFLLLGLFKAKSSYVKGVKRHLLRLMAERRSEPDSIDGTYTTNHSSKRVIVTFKGGKSHFQTLYGWDKFLYNELRAITHNKWLRIVDEVKSVPIGINVRIGNDFSTAKSPTDYYTKGAIKTPISWFRNSLELIRGIVGFPVQAFVVSDGNREDLTDILDLNNVVFVRPGCAISDLLLLAKSKVLLASGASSFSAWASFLGQMPTISHPGQPLGWFKMTNRQSYYNGEFDPSSPNQAFIEQAKSVLS